MTFSKGFKNVDQLDWLELDPVTKAASKPEDYHRDFRHSYEGHVDIMDSWVAQKAVPSRSAAAKVFTQTFNKWKGMYGDSYDKSGLHKSKRTPMSSDFVTYLMDHQPKKAK